jgi:hypothetical protein
VAYKKLDWPHGRGGVKGREGGLFSLQFAVQYTLVDAETTAVEVCRQGRDGININNACGRLGGQVFGMDFSGQGVCRPGFREE